MNSFDEASFFNAVKWVGGRCECIREAPVASCRLVISAAPLVLPKPPCARVARGSQPRFELTRWTLLNTAVRGLS